MSSNQQTQHNIPAAEEIAELIVSSRRTFEYVDAHRAEDPEARKTAEEFFAPKISAIIQRHQKTMKTHPIAKPLPARIATCQAELPANPLLESIIRATLLVAVPILFWSAIIYGIARILFF